MLVQSRKNLAPHEHRTPQQAWQPFVSPPDSTEHFCRELEHTVQRGNTERARRGMPRGATPIPRSGYRMPHCTESCSRSAQSGPPSKISDTRRSFSTALCILTLSLHGRASHREQSQPFSSASAECQYDCGRATTPNTISTNTWTPTRHAARTTHSTHASAQLLW